jgi:peroxiredoxin
VRGTRTGLRGALAALGLLVAAPASAGQVVGKPASDFSLPALGGGNQTRLSTLRGKVVLVDFWATWCEPCRKELPELEKLQQALAARGVVILGVSIDKERTNAQELATQLKLTLAVLHDPEGKVAELYDPPKMPSSYVIDRDGVVRYINQGFTGAADVARLRQQLEKLSQPATGSPPAP